MQELASWIRVALVNRCWLHCCKNHAAKKKPLAGVACPTTHTFTRSWPGGKKGRRGSYETACTHMHPLCRSAFTVAVVGSAVVVRYQVTQRWKQQEARGSRRSEKLSWEDRVVVEEQKMSTTPPQALASDNENGMCKSCFDMHCACGSILRGYQVLKPPLVGFTFMFFIWYPLYLRWCNKLPTVRLSSRVVSCKLSILDYYTHLWLQELPCTMTSVAMMEWFHIASPHLMAFVCAHVCSA